MLPPSQPLIHNRQLNQHKSLLNPNSVTAQHVSAAAAETFQTCNMLKVFSASFKLILPKRLEVGLQPKLLQFRNNKDDHIHLLLQINKCEHIRNRYRVILKDFNSRCVLFSACESLCVYACFIMVILKETPILKTVTRTVFSTLANDVGIICVQIKYFFAH